MGLVLVVLLAFALQAQDVPAAGQISGHIYGMNSSEPIPNAVVSLTSVPTGKTRMQRTAEGGSYSFTDLELGGAFYLTASCDGFNPAIYRVGASERASFTVLGFDGSRKLEQIDLSLPQRPEIVPMHDEPLAAAYHDDRNWLQFPIGRFSPNSKYFAFTVRGRSGGVWIYDMDRRQLGSVAVEPASLLEPGVADIQWISDTLYICASRWIAVTGHETKVLNQLSPIVKDIIDEREYGGSPAGKYRFEVERLCHGCAWRVWVWLNDHSKRRRVLTVDYDNVVADLDQPFLFYDIPGYPNAIARLNLRTRHLVKISVPAHGTEVIAAKRDGQGFLVAYRSPDKCIPELEADGAL